MLYVENNNTNPYCNHALEEWLIDNRQEDCFMLWRNEKALLLGKNQNVYSEIDLEYAKSCGVKIVRRVTGGGTVYTDEGAIMFSCISGSGLGFANFRRFTEPVVAALRSLGVPAEFSGRNDLTIDGMKFSGNAQCTYHSKLLHHGTLMYNTDIGEMSKLLRVNKLKLQDKGVSSVRSRVTNICEHMTKAMDIEDFRSYLWSKIIDSDKDARFLRLSGAEWHDVRRRAAEKHAMTKWIFGRSPGFNVKREAKLPGGTIQVYLNVSDSRIVNTQIFGDFFGDRDIGDIERALLGVEYNALAVRDILNALPLNEYLYNISLVEFLDLIWGELS